jgi:hypothetical protein
MDYLDCLGSPDFEALQILDGEFGSILECGSLVLCYGNTYLVFLANPTCLSDFELDAPR